MAASRPTAGTTRRSTSAPPGATTQRSACPPSTWSLGSSPSAWLSLAKRWLLGTHQRAVRPKHLPAYLDEFVFRFTRRTAKSISHRFARLIEHAVQTPPTTYRGLVATPA
jgi:hypothetical protein